MSKKGYIEQFCRIMNQHNGLTYEVCSFHVDGIRKIGVPSDDRDAYPALCTLLSNLYWRYQFSLPRCASFSESQKSFVDYWKLMPEAAYEILELFHPFFVVEEDAAKI